MATPSANPQVLLNQARAARTEGNYVRQLDAARRSAVLNGPHREAALLEALEALVLLARFGEARALVRALRSVGGPRTRVRVAAWHSHIEVLEGNADRARALLDGVADLVRSHAQPHDLFLVAIARSRMEQASDRPLAAIEHAEEALDLAPASGGNALVTAHEYLGQLWLDLGVLDRSVAAFEAGLALSSVAAARRAALHMGACSALRRAGDAGAARRHGEHAVALHFAGGRTYREGVARLALAEALLAAGARAEALAEARLALERVRTGRSVVSEMEGRLCLAKILVHEKLTDAASYELDRILASPVTQLHGEAAVVRAELVTTPHDPVLATLEERLPTLSPAFRARAFWVLATQATAAGRRDAARMWFERHGDARAEAAADEARRRFRVVEIRDQVEALRRERRRGEELAEALRTQELLREAAEAAETERRDLLELVAHDLRNPLSALLLMLDAVDEAEDLPEARELITLGRRSAQAMRSVLDEALTASGSIGELGETEPVDLAAVVRGTVGAFEAGARAKGQVLTLGPIPEAVVDGVPGLLRSVLDNLLSNALKFTPRGGAVRVEGQVVGAEVVVWVADDGPGLQPGESERLFHRRVMGAARPTGGESSTGLGLYLVRKVVEGHGGSVSAASEGPGRGATFTVRLPLAPTS